MRSAVFISSGLGNAITLVPLIKSLKRAGHSVTAIYTSEFKCEELFKGSNLFDDSIRISSKLDFALKVLGKANRFDYLFADRFSCTPAHFWFGRRVSKNIMAQHQGDLNTRKVTYVRPDPSLHSIQNNLNLAKDIIPELNADMSFTDRPETLRHIVFQPGSGNHKTPWKSYPIDKWIEVLKQINYPITVIGDENEKALISALRKSGIEKLTLVIGQTSIQEMVRKIGSAKLFIGHDSGPMHIAASFDIPTFTVWGGSNSTLYGYENLYPEKHKVVKQQVDCNPCDSWLNRNVSRVSSPEKCPDFKCIKELSPEYVTSQLKDFLQRIDSEIPVK